MTAPGLVGARPRAPLAVGLPAAALVFVLDQASKWWVLEVARLAEVRHVPGPALGPLGLDLSMVWNRGVTFGLLAGDSPWVQTGLTLLALGIAAFLVRWLTRAETRGMALALGAVIGGAAGNALDRLRFGAVVDFVHAHLTVGGNTWHWYVFNLADAAIVVGVGALVADALFRPGAGAKETA